MAATSGPFHAKPVSWAASESWFVLKLDLFSNLVLADQITRDGADGDWSSFWLRVGNPGQSVRVLPSTAGQATWVVAPGGCLPGEAGKLEIISCSDSRGELFDASKSTSWNSTGNYTMGLEMNLGYNDTATFGLDTVALGASEAIGGPSLDSQVVAAYANDDYYIGMFGLSSQPTNFSLLANSTPSFLTTLKAMNIIPSLSWGYTAGARYQAKGGAFASLTLGGYDSSRMVPHNVSFTLHQDVSRDLVVVLQSVTADFRNGSAISLLSDPIVTFIDSTIPYLYLPSEACQEFERVFGLVWNTTYQAYFVDENLHQRLLQANNNITFRLADSETSSATVDISLPYASFDLLMDYPLLPSNLSGTRYFPLMRAANDSQYTLGRTFLQESYLVTNYECANFSIYQSRYEDGTRPNVVAISPVNASSRPSLGRASKIGIGVGSTIAFCLSLLALFLTVKKWRKTRGEKHEGVAAPRVESPEKSVAADVSRTQEIGINSYVGPYRELPDSGRVELAPNVSASTNVGQPSGPIMAAMNELDEPSPPIANELMNLQAFNEGSMIQNRNAKNKYKIFVSTNMSRQSWRSGGSQVEGPRIETTISSRRPKRYDVDRSLPPTPISESVQASPIRADFNQCVPIVKTSDAISTRSTAVKSCHGDVREGGSAVPLNAWQRDFSHLSYSSMDMEIVVPPGSSEVDVIKPLRINKRDGRRRQNFF